MDLTERSVNDYDRTIADSGSPTYSLPTGLG